MPGVRVFRVDGEICFGNVTSVEEKLLQALAERNLPTAYEADAREGHGRDMDEMSHGKGLTACVPKRLPAKKEAGAFATPLNRERTVYALAHGEVHGELHPDSPTFGIRRRRSGRRGRAAHEMEAALSEIPCVDEAHSPKSDGSLESGEPSTDDIRVPVPHPLSPLFAVILDCSRVVDVDANGAVTLKHLSETFKAAGVPLLLAALPGPVRDSLERYGVGMQTDSSAAKKGEGNQQVPQPADPARLLCCLPLPKCWGSSESKQQPKPAVNNTLPESALSQRTIDFPARMAHPVVNTTCYLTVSAALVAALRHAGKQNATISVTISAPQCATESALV